MKISKSKRQLAQLLIEAGVTQFPEGAKWAAQDKSDTSVYYYENKPHRLANWESWYHDGIVVANGVLQVNTLINNWHQTVLSRDEFDHIVAETMQDADGWIEWMGGERPDGVFAEDVEVRLRDGWITTKSAGVIDWRHLDNQSDVVSYRLHKPKQDAVVEYNDLGVVYTGPSQSEFTAVENQTLDQLLKDWRNADDYAKRKQAEADEAAKAADGKWEAVQAKAAELGVTIEAGVVKAEAPELEITDWRDLKVGDEVEIIEPQYEHNRGRFGIVSRFDKTDDHKPVRVEFCGGSRAYDWPTKWRFIRRP